MAIISAFQKPRTGVAVLYQSEAFRIWGYKVFISIQIKELSLTDVYLCNGLRFFFRAVVNVLA